MSIELRMPALSPTMESGSLARWLVTVGDAVRPGDLLAEIETDKATMEVEATDEGYISSLLVEAGTDDVAVGTVLALLAPLDGSASRVIEQPSAERGDEAPALDEAAGAETSDLTPVAVERTPDVAAGRKPRRRSPADRIKVSPLAQRIAVARGMDLHAITGSGPDGRIVRADLGIRRPVAAASDVPVAVVSPTPAPPPAGVPFETERLSSMRRTIARRLTEAKQNIPHFYLTVHCVIDELLALRQELNGSLAERGIRLSVNDFLLKALGFALEQEPGANVQFAGNEMYRFRRADVSMAVAIEGGLVTPVIRDLTRLSLSAIAQRSRDLASRARAGTLQPVDYEGGTASLSNLGMFGIDEMVPVINPPQAVIVGIGRSRRLPWEMKGEMELATIITATASFDHRVIDGATAAQFLSAFEQALAAPLLLLS